jgi:hypothetical protein
MVVQDREHASLIHKRVSEKGNSFCSRSSKVNSTAVSIQVTVDLGGRSVRLKRLDADSNEQ